MRAYLPMNPSSLSAFSQSKKLSSSYLIAPTEKVAEDYGVSELEDLEYAALEIARTKSEQEHYPIIATFDCADLITTDVREVEPGIINGAFSFLWEELVAIYRITEADEELEWYDVSEYFLLLEKVSE